MSYRDLIKGLVNTAITSNIGDLKSSVVLRSVSTSSYDPVSGQIVKTSVDYTCYGLLTNLTQQDVPSEVIDVTARKLLVPTQQLPGIDVDALDDQAVVDGVAWTITSIKQDPAFALYTFVLKSREGVKVRAS